MSAVHACTYLKGLLTEKVFHPERSDEIDAEIGKVQAEADACQTCNKDEAPVAEAVAEPEAPSEDASE